MHIPPFLDFSVQGCLRQEQLESNPSSFLKTSKLSFSRREKLKLDVLRNQRAQVPYLLQHGWVGMLRTIARHAGAWLKYCSCLKHPWTEKSANGGSFRLSQTALICGSLIILADCTPLIPFNPFYPLHNIRCGLPCLLRRKATFKISCDTELMSMLK
jgi:hypothetical protein